MSKEKIVLAYSGGLDTSIIIAWLRENYDCEVIAVSEGYTTMNSCENGIASVKKNAADAEIVVEE